MAVVSTGSVTLSSSASLKTLRNVRYRPGHESYVLFTALFTVGNAGSTQWIGMFNTTDGMAVGYNNSTFSIFWRSNSTTTIIPQSSFNIDKLNGTGSSGFTVVPTNLNVYRLSFGWLGAGILKWQILGSSGTWITFHILQYPNSQTVPVFTNPMLPIQAAVTNSVGLISLQTAGWNGGSVDDLRNRAGYRTFVVNSNGVNISSTGVETHLITIQNNTTFNSLTNAIELRFVGLGGGPLDSADVVLLRFRSNATVTGTSYTNINATESVVSYTTAGTYTAGTGTVMYVRPVNTEGNGSAMQLLSQSDPDIIVLPGQTFTVTAQSYTGSSNNIIGILMWEERF
jgi:hypothetical protein